MYLDITVTYKQKIKHMKFLGPYGGTYPCMYLDGT
jgi:hypothetical protein